MRVLLLVLHRKGRSPGQRYRIEQHLPFFKEKGIEINISPLIKSEEEDLIFYDKGKVLAKVYIGLKAIFRRLRDYLRRNEFDHIFIFRDAFFFGTFFERLFSLSKAKIIFDFDDAIWLQDKNPNQGFFQRLKNPEKTDKITSIADHVIVGNEYLRSYAKKYNDNVSIIPSTIDFSTYGSVTKNENEKVCIGWTGSFSTIKHFETILEALKEIGKKYGDGVYFKLIGDPKYVNEDLKLKGTKWQAETEAQDLIELDIGLMPLPDDEWSRGKCAMKGLQYMALEIPTIMSPVGVNKDIIQDGENGFLASTQEEWIEKLSLLIENAALRKKMGKAGYETVKESYSVEANKEKWLQVFQS